MINSTEQPLKGTEKVSDHRERVLAAVGGYMQSRGKKHRKSNSFPNRPPTRRNGFSGSIKDTTPP